jgi:putative transposase
LPWADESDPFGVGGVAGPKIPVAKEPGMSQSLSKILVHIIFSTKNRAPFLRTQGLHEKMNAYMIGALENLRCPSLQVGTVDDHIHILCHLSRTMSVAELLEEIKKSSSKWVKTEANSLSDFHWQAGYGAFSVSPSAVPEVKEYIANQEEHHRKRTFQEEFRLFLQRHGIEYDERYVWD